MSAPNAMLLPLLRPVLGPLLLSPADLFNSSGAKVYPPIDLTASTLDASITYASSGGKTYFDSNGTMQTAASNVWPLEYDPVTHVALGRSIWESRINQAHFSSDLTNAAWVKTSATVAQNLTDLFGTANAASTVTATAANATVLQTVTRAAAQCAYSVYLKRVTGTGTVAITSDNGATWTTVTLTAAWTRFTFQQSVLNPVIGARLSVSGDAIGMTAAQLEAGTSAGPYIPTPSSSNVTRALETAAILTLSSLGFNPNVGTLVAKGISSTGVNGSNNNVIASISDGTSSNRINETMTTSTTASAFVITAGTTQAQMSRTCALAAAFHVAIAWQLNDFAVALNGSAVLKDSAGTVPLMSRLDIGNQADTATRSWNGIIQSLQYFPMRLSDATLVTASA